MRIPWPARGSTATFGRRRSRTSSRRWRLLLVPAIGIAFVCQLSLTGSAGASTDAAIGAYEAAHAGIAPNPTNELDCNGWSAKYRSVRPLAGMDCVDPVKIVDGKARPFVDNGWYVGHDEPSVKFISSKPGSGNTMTYYAKLPVDPKTAPTASGSVTDYGELSVAPWFGLPMCDPDSYPQNPCTPDSDSNVGMNVPNAAGSAFMELQLYPPGYTPFPDAPSCSIAKWCAALTIDSAECNFNFFYCNPDCEEPTNFAFLQTNGVPTGPPGPQLANVETFLPNSHTLLFNQGDVLQISITDPSKGFTTTIHDLTTGQTGWMTASANNGFMDTNFSTCNGTPHTFHAEYSTASINNRVPWAALEGGVLMEQEIGHSEVCGSLTNQDPVAIGYPDGSSFIDSDSYDTCMGGEEGDQVGEGPCAFTASGQIACQNALTQGPYGTPVGCQSEYADTGLHCEFADGYCFPQGSRTYFVNGNPETGWSDANECFANRYQNGDLDFDGVDYQPDTWPNGGPDHPTPFEYVGPFTNGQSYPQIQFETDISGSANLCAANGQGCTVPPVGAKFYPFWSLSPQSSALGSKQTSCVWNFGNNLPTTTENFGGDKEYGNPDLSWYYGTNVSKVQANPQFSGACTGASYA
ncbi:MAG TPA: hypothetical protein VME19_04555 [Streptosporangiaceae bacterium]|nr:hypothetical protein [Streptosporangiaceae bacterium]